MESNFERNLLRAGFGCFNSSSAERVLRHPLFRLLTDFEGL